MTSSSSDRRQRAVVLTADEAGTLAGLLTPELRSGHWTRLGDASVLGDRVTEGVLGDVAERVRAAAAAEGYAAGWSQGRRAAADSAAQERRLHAAEQAAEQARRDTELEAAVTALAQAADDVRSHLSQLAETVEGQATSLAWAIVEEIVGREVATVTGPDVVRRVLAVLPATAVARVRLHPDVVREPAVQALVEHSLDLVPDPALGRADALVEHDGAVVDLRIDEALARVREVLAAEEVAP